MCGIAGYVGTHRPELLGPMCDALAYRGPDDSGEWTAIVEHDFPRDSRYELGLSVVDESLPSVIEGQVVSVEPARVAGLEAELDRWLPRFMASAGVPGAAVAILKDGEPVMSRGFGKYQDDLGPSLDAPALMLQTALLLLERSAPAGPSATAEQTEVDVEDEINPIHVDSGTAAGSYLAPWRVKGTISPVSETGRKFDLDFTFSTGNPGEELAGNMRLSGLAEYADSEFPQPPSTSLVGWQLFWIDDSDPAAEGAATLRTLADLRSWISGHQIR